MELPAAKEGALFFSELLAPQADEPAGGFLPCVCHIPVPGTVWGFHVALPRMAVPALQPGKFRSCQRAAA